MFSLQRQRHDDVTVKSIPGFEDESPAHGRDLVTVGRGAATSLIGTALGTIGGLAVTMLLTRALGTGGYGSIAIATSVAVLVQLVGNAGLSMGSARMMSLARAQDDEPRALRLLKANIIIGTITGAAGTCVVLGLAFSRLISDRDVAAVLAITAPLALLSVLRSALFGGLRAYRDLRSVLILSTVVPLLDVAVVGGMVAVGVRSISMYAGGFVLVAALELGFTAWLFGRGRRIGSLLHTTRADIRSLLAFSVPLLMTQVFYFSIRSIDVTMLGFLRSAEEAGLYSPIMRLAESATKVLAAFPLLFVPVATAYIAKQRWTDLQHLYVAVTKWAYLLGFPLILLLAVSPSPILSLLFGAPYAEMDSAARVLALGYWFVLITGLNGVTLGSLGAVKEMAVVSLIGLALTIVLGMSLISSFGPVGAAWTNTLAYLFANVAFSVVLYRRVGVSPLRRDTVRLFVFSCVLLVVGSTVAEILPRGLAWSLAVVALLTVAWLSLALTTPSFEMRWAFIKDVVRRGTRGRSEADSPSNPFDVSPLSPGGDHP